MLYYSTLCHSISSLPGALSRPMPVPRPPFSFRTTCGRVSLVTWAWGVSVAEKQNYHPPTPMHKICWRLRKTDVYAPPQDMCHTGAAIVKVGVEIVVVTANLCTKIPGFRGFDSSRILILRGGILMSIGNFSESLSQQIFVGIILVGRLGVAALVAVQRSRSRWHLRNQGGGSRDPWKFSESLCSGSRGRGRRCMFCVFRSGAPCTLNKIETICTMGKRRGPRMAR